MTSAWMNRGAGFVCIVMNKETKVYKIDSSDDVERKFEELGVGDSTELVNSYWVLNHYSFANFCQKEFADKRIPKSEYFQLTNEDLEKLKRILEEDELKSTKLIREESDARRISRLKEYREKYYKSNEFKRFIMRHDKKFNGAFGCGFSLLILSPLVFFAVMTLEGFGISRYFLLLPLFSLFFFVLWGSHKDDKYNQRELLSDEDNLIKENKEIWKGIYKAEDEYKKRTGK